MLVREQEAGESNPSSWVQAPLKATVLHVFGSYELLVHIYNTYPFDD